MTGDQHQTNRPRTEVAYFSMEIGLSTEVPTYAGGLGVLAGDTLRAAADMGTPIAGVTLLHRRGYFRQHLDEHGQQYEEPAAWDPADHLVELGPRVAIELERRPVQIRAWQALVEGTGGAEVPVYFLDTMLPENDPADRDLTSALYGGTGRDRVRQEAVLGLGGVAMLEALGHTNIATYHMNEGHSALLALALLRGQLGDRPPGDTTDDDLAAVRQRCVFTTHTPVPEGHDQFSLDLVREQLSDDMIELLRATGCCTGGVLNMTELALLASRYINGVARRHREVSRDMFPAYPIDSITNGVHAATWTTTPFKKLFDRFIPEWRRNNLHLRHAAAIPQQEIRAAHAAAKHAMIDAIRQRNGVMLNPDAFTIGFARRATPYKRTDLIFSDLERLRAIARHSGPLQIVFAGKAHPHDENGKAMIRRIYEAAQSLGHELPVVYLEEYDMDLARHLCGGVDLWLNTPQRPQEASGTSGMKAALNGVPSLSVLDGWWIEGHVEGVTGWSIGETWDTPSDPDQEDTNALYDKLERTIVPAYFGSPEAYGRVMRSAIALNGSFFNAERMLRQYIEHAYRL